MIGQGLYGSLCMSDASNTGINSSSKTTLSSSLLTTTAYQIKNEQDQKIQTEELDKGIKANQ